MATYVKMAIAVTLAEFPDFQICMSFRVFNLGKTTHTSGAGSQCPTRLAICKNLTARSEKNHHRKL